MPDEENVMTNTVEHTGIHFYHAGDACQYAVDGLSTTVSGLTILIIGGLFSLLLLAIKYAWFKKMKIEIVFCPIVTPVLGQIAISAYAALAMLANSWLGLGLL
jgi:hypothetical protein